MDTLIKFCKGNYRTVKNFGGEKTLTNLANHNNSPTFFHQFSCFCNMRHTQLREVHFNVFCVRIKERIHSDIAVF